MVSCDPEMFGEDLVPWNAWVQQIKVSTISDLSEKLWDGGEWGETAATPEWTLFRIGVKRSKCLWIAQSESTLGGIFKFSQLVHRNSTDSHPIPRVLHSSPSASPLSKSMHIPDYPNATQSGIYSGTQPSPPENQSIFRVQSPLKSLPEFHHKTFQ